jgi:hypothetical protein
LNQFHKTRRRTFSESSPTGFFVWLSSVLLCLDLSFVLCGRHIERPAGARPLYGLPRFFWIWLGLVVGVGVRRCWFGWVMDWWGALALGGENTKLGLLTGCWVQIGLVETLARKCRIPVLCRYSVLIAQAQMYVILFCNSIMATNSDLVF